MYVVPFMELVRQRNMSTCTLSDNFISYYYAHTLFTLIFTVMFRLFIIATYTLITITHVARKIILNVD